MTDASPLTHLDEAGHARMVEVSHKQPSFRRAVARCEVRMDGATLSLIAAGGIPKGDVLATARIAGIMAAKRTAELIPLCHPLPLGAIGIEIAPSADAPALEIEASVTTHARTGVEMEALTAASVAALTIYDMCKAVDRSMRIDRLRVTEKSGGTSDHAARDDRA